MDTVVVVDETSQKTLRVTVSDTLCSGHGRCYTLSPDVFHSDEEGYCAERGAEFQVLAGLEQQAFVGRDACPEGAITVVAD